ncbi:MAG: restriction endonuclease subunit S [Xylophilus sp.]|nr:restriction endonuclease subunit S [Xylophilus sp.]
MSAVPSGWKVERLKDVARVNANALPAGTDADYEFDYLEISNVNYNGVVSTDAIEHLRFEDAPSRARRRVASGSTVISSVRPNLQAVAFFASAPKHLICSTGFNVVEPQSNKLAPQFTYYHLLSENARQYFEAAATGVGYPAIGDKDFNAFTVTLPPLPEQQRISTYLDASCAAIDAAVSAKRRQLDTLEALRMSIIQRAVTQGINPKVKLKSSGLDWVSEVPEHWKVQQIKRKCSLVRGQFTHRPRNDPALYDGPYPFVQTGDITAADKYIRTYSQTLNELGLSASKQFPRGTLVMSIAANIGDVAILDFEACFPDSMIGMIPGHQAHLDFLYYLMRAMRPIMLRSAVQSTQLNLNYVRIGTNFAPFPPLEEQRVIAKYLDAKEAESSRIRATITAQIDTLIAYRKSLIHECVTGQRRVTEADVAAIA